MANPYRKVKPKEVKDISEKAIKVICFDGTSAVLPKSCVRHNYITDVIHVPTWLANKNELQYQKKVVWL
tara:strand:- start:4511 stop:4717 length:207 start_codon:yes stop_codon:yes gene_type:complete